ncbi:hypothetical protein BG011_006802 [Mortierella polycephala]|uniref:F-box domain-containing protein n=1 Tax=Mortierella polycephala TaxID=41804 RepID=A0A9P6U8T4_9FUNG|nr:hypothetical protein BG011_006802 [Mortierella polycephala]
MAANCSAPIFKLFVIPEMFDMVQSYFSNSDRIRCSRVSKDFSVLFSPVLWRTISLRTRRQHECFTSNPQIVATITKYAHCIRTIRVRTCKSLSPFVTAGPEKLTNLRNLEIMLPTRMESEYCAFQSIENYKAYKATTSNGLDDDFEGLNWKDDDQDPRGGNGGFSGRHRSGREWLDDPEVFVMTRWSEVRHNRLHEILDCFPEVQDQLFSLQMHLSFQRDHLQQLQVFQQEQLQHHRLQQQMVLSPIRQTQVRILHLMNSIRLLERMAHHPLTLFSDSPLESVDPDTYFKSITQVDPWDHDEPWDQKALQKVLENAPQLQAFAACTYPFWNQEVQETIINKLSSLRMLSIAHYTRGTFMYLPDLDGILNANPHLQTLRIANYGRAPPSGHIPVNTGSPVAYESSSEIKVQDADDLECIETAVVVHNHGIQHLFLECANWFLTQPVSFRSFRSLRSLTLVFIDSRVLKIIAKSIQRHCFQLENLALVQSQLESASITKLLDACNKYYTPTISRSTSSSSSSSADSLTTINVDRVGLKSLRLEIVTAREFSPVVDELLRHSRTLQHLAVRDCTSISNPLETANKMLSVLESFEHLETFDILSSTERVHGIHNTVSAQALVESATRSPSGWACARTLKVLKLSITDLEPQPQLIALEAPQALEPSQPALPVQFEPVTDEDEMEMYRLQRRVCEALGTLEFLEELVLGVDEDDSQLYEDDLGAGYQVDSLTLSLNLGLAHLERLKQLRVLKVARMAHHIGVAELEWMFEHWPRLEAIYGLLRFEDEAEDKEVEQWIRENHPELEYT